VTMFGGLSALALIQKLLWRVIRVAI
jgi:hypothetical protein